MTELCSCGGTIIEDIISGMVCSSCGIIHDEDGYGLTHEVQFVPGSKEGSARVQGNLISHDGRAAFRSDQIQSRTSRQITLDNVKREMTEIMNQVGMLDGLTQAMYIYEICICHNFTCGRKRRAVISCCLYFICRRDNTQNRIMLIDFSDKVQINVFTLGNMFMKMKYFLSNLKRKNEIDLSTLKIPNLDPALLIIKFSLYFDFEPHTIEVQNYAAKLVASMKKHWINAGRRPVGIVAVALLLAARAYKFIIRVDDVALMLPISASTILRRMKEIKLIPTAHFCVDKFDPNKRQVDNDEDNILEWDPPSYIRNRLKDQIKKKLEEERAIRNERQQKNRIKLDPSCKILDIIKDLENEGFGSRTVNIDGDEIHLKPSLKQYMHLPKDMSDKRKEKIEERNQMFMKLGEAELAPSSKNLLDTEDAAITIDDYDYDNDMNTTEDDYESEIQSGAEEEKRSSSNMVNDNDNRANKRKEKRKSQTFEGIPVKEISNIFFLNEKEIEKKRKVWYNEEENKKFLDEERTRKRKREADDKKRAEDELHGRKRRGPIKGQSRMETARQKELQAKEPKTKGSKINTDAIQDLFLWSSGYDSDEDESQRRVVEHPAVREEKERMKKKQQEIDQQIVNNVNNENNVTATNNTATVASSEPEQATVNVQEESDYDDDDEGDEGCDDAFYKKLHEEVYADPDNHDYDYDDY